MKRYLRFLQLNDKTQLMICKVDGLRGSGNNDYFIDKLLQTFEEKSMQLQIFVQVVLVEKQRSGELSKRKNKKKSKKNTDELDDEYVIMIANMQALIKTAG